MSKREDAFLPFGTTLFNFYHIINKYKTKFYEYKYSRNKFLKLVMYYMLIGKLINLPDFISWNSDENKKFLEQKFHINLGTEHYDCTMHEFANWIAYKKYGFSYITLRYCKMIRNNKINRRIALNRVAVEEGVEPKKLDYYMETLRVTASDIEYALEKSRIFGLKFFNKIGQFMRKYYLQKLLI